MGWLIGSWVWAGLWVMGPLLTHLTHGWAAHLGLIGPIQLNGPFMLFCSYFQPVHFYNWHPIFILFSWAREHLQVHR